jgi:1-pyrroline-5-carboxylate dehydrogenase
MTLEVGKTRSEALADAEESADLIRYYSQQMEDAAGFDRPMGKLSPGEKTRDILKPYGVFGVIAPFNFPLALSAGMSAGALLAGNTVVFKPSPDAPTTGVKLLEILREAGLPEGAMSYLTDSGAEVGKTLVASPKVSGIVFTGSKKVGFAIYQSGRTRPSSPRARISKRRRKASCGAPSDSRDRSAAPRVGCTCIGTWSHASASFSSGRRGTS